MNPQEVDKQTDLPLMANFEQIQAAHYLIDLKCDMDSKVFEGDVIIFFKPIRLAQDCYECILDCCDINVLEVSEVIYDHSELPSECETVQNQKRISNSWKTIESTKSDKNVMTKWTMKQNIPLQFKYDDWSLHIFKKEEDPNFPRVIQIKYVTKPDSRSLHWRDDQDGNPCVYTPAAAINNRGLFPCQDIPGAMATWQAKIHTKSSSNLTVLCTGDNQDDVLLDNGNDSHYFFTNLILPMSTFAIAIGSWKKEAILEPSSTEKPMLSLCGPLSIVNQHLILLKKYVNACLEATSRLLGTYPLGKLDILILPRHFSGLGLASPNLMFLSNSLITGDLSMLVKVAHEISHSWFGIMIGAEDWTEPWISEGFATFLEEHIHDSALEFLNWKTDTTKEAKELRIYLRHKNLSQEMAHTTQDLQQLRPMQGNKLQSDDVGFVKNGMNPAAGLSQVHYLKGYFLLQYLYEIVGHVPFFNLLQQYISKYMGQLVNSTHFIRLFCEMFPSECLENDITVDWLVSTWLHSSGMPTQILQLRCLDMSRNALYSQIDEFFSEVCYLNQHLNKKLTGQKKQKLNVELMSDPLSTPEQISLLFEKMLEIEAVHFQLLKILKKQHDTDIRMNPDLNHRWCELVVKNKYRRCYSDVVFFLTEQQSMGVYLYGEMALSKNKTLIGLARNTFKELEHELDVNSAAVIRDMFKDFL